MPWLVVERQPMHYTGLPLFEYHDAGAGPTVGQAVALDADEVVVGRDPIGLRYHHPEAAVIYLPFPAINRYHARFRRIGAGYVIEDMQSRNGTYVNGVRVGTAALGEGDRIRMTDFEFVFRAAGRRSPTQDQGTPNQPRQPTGGA